MSGATRVGEPSEVGAPAPTIRFMTSRVADLAWHVLACLDLGADAASLRDPALPAAPRALLDAYGAASGRLWLHWAPLWLQDDEDQLVALETVLNRTPALGDAAGRALCAHLLGAASEAEQRHAARWESASHTPSAAAALVPPLVAVRASLWSPAAPPPLRVLHAPSLRHHARAATVRGERVVATSLDEPPSHSLCQILHEETHPISDRTVPPAGDRDTRAGSPGHATHLRLERAAVERTAVALSSAAPELLPAYAEWRRRHSM